ncbi:extracellular solute-binding protein [Longimonas halophila]|nr:extracellular solute-binding protein [Longimonas halophila]
MINKTWTVWSVLGAVLLSSMALMGCGTGDDADTTDAESDELVIYTGRSQALVEPLVEMYREQTDREVRVRYGSDAQLLAALAEEGDQSPADVFWANTTGALGNAAEEGRLTDLPDDLLGMADYFVPSNAQWTPVTARFRVLAYNTDRVDPEDLPSSVLDLPAQSNLEGRFGWTPAYSSFQDFVTALRVVEDSASAATWLADVEANLDPNSYTSNTPLVEALAAEEIDAGLTNHYYVLRKRYGDAKVDDESTIDPEAPIAIHRFADGDVGNLALVTGAGVLQTSTAPEAGHDFLRFLLNTDAQTFAAETVNEYPVVNGIDVPSYMLPVDEALQTSPEFDLEQLRNIDGTLDLLRNQGLL